MIGENQIACGDCLPLMMEFPDKYFDLIVTDPPYGINEAAGKNRTRGGRGKLRNNTRHRKIPPKDYGNSDWDAQPPGEEYFGEMFRVSKNQVIFGGNFFHLPPSPCWIVWDKDNTGDFADCELAWTSFKTAVRKFKFRWNGLLQEDMAHREVRTHPTQKPLKLMEWVLERYSKAGDIILDPFMGSGPVIQAASKLQRRYVGIDICPEYCEMAQARLNRVSNSRIFDFIVEEES